MSILALGKSALGAAAVLKLSVTRNAYRWSGWKNGQKRVANGKTTILVEDANVRMIVGEYTDPVYPQRPVKLDETHSGLLTNQRRWGVKISYPIRLTNAANVTSDKSVVYGMDLSFPIDGDLTGAILEEYLIQGLTDVLGTLVSSRAAAAKFDSIISGQLPTNAS